MTFSIIKLDHHCSLLMNNLRNLSIFFHFFLFPTKSDWAAIVFYLEGTPGVICFIANYFVIRITAEVTC